MEIKETFVGKLNGVFGVWCGFKPEKAVITDIKKILIADEGKILKHKETGELTNTVCLKNGDTEENYEEIEEEVQNDITN